MSVITTTHEHNSDSNSRPEELGNSQPEVLIREIHKNGWLIKYSGSDKKYGFSKGSKSRKYWVIFCVHDDVHCFLEFYETRLSGFSHKPFFKVNLDKCLHISPSIIIHEEEHEFIITLETEVVRLAAFTRDQMTEWIETIRNKLREIGILNPKDNIYSKEPEPVAVLAPSRDPCSPLPATPTMATSIPEGTEILFNAGPGNSNSSNENELSLRVSQMPTPSQASEETPLVHGSTTITITPLNTTNGAERSRHISLDFVNTSNYSATAINNPNEVSIASESSGHYNFSDALAESNVIYGTVFDNCNYENNNGNWLSNESEVRVVESGDQSAYEQLFLASTSRVNATDNTGANGPRANEENRLQESRLNSGSQIISLRQQQVIKLRREMQHGAGVRIILKRKDSLSTISFVECFGNIWVAGWKQKEYPFLHGALHIGDCLKSVGGFRPNNLQNVRKILMHSNGASVEFIVQRVPFGNIHVLMREFEGQDLGIIQEGNTPEIKEVVPTGLASHFGLTSQAPCVEKLGSCNWFITEVNSRPLNLFFKGTEVQERLNAVGKEISILVQPSDLIKAIKKQLKKVKNYKTYLVQ